MVVMVLGEGGRGGGGNKGQYTYHSFLLSLSLPPPFTFFVCCCCSSFLWSGKWQMPVCPKGCDVPVNFISQILFDLSVERDVNIELNCDLRFDDQCFALV